MARAAAHGVTGGLANAIGGGDFGSGFLSSFTASFASSGMALKGSGFFGTSGGALDKAPKFVFRRIMAASLIGGTTSEISGGKFANGVAAAAIQHLFNDEFAGGGILKKNEDGSIRKRGYTGDEDFPTSYDYAAELDGKETTVTIETENGVKIVAWKNSSTNENLTTNCHGYSIANGEVIIHTQEMGDFLDNKKSPIAMIDAFKAAVGDLVVYRRNGAPVHSGRVAAVGSDGPILISQMHLKRPPRVHTTTIAEAQSIYKADSVNIIK